MNKSIYVSEELTQKVRTAMAGNWKSVLASKLGDKVVAKPNQPCPFCGGTDRFSFVDKHDDGGCFCRHCGFRDGFKVLMDLEGKNFYQVVADLAFSLGIPVEPAKESTSPEKPQRKKPSPEFLWKSATPLIKDNSAVRYLASRGLHGFGLPSLRFSKKLRYAEMSEDNSWSESFHEGLLCRVDTPHKECVNVLRIYLDEGRKANVKVAKKILGNELSGGFIRLGDIDPEDGRLGIAEGVETALSASELFGIPVWSVVAAFNLRNFVPPASVRHLVIFADADHNYIGQREAYTAAAALAAKFPHLKISVRLPKSLGTDWNDVLLKQAGKRNRANASS